MEIRLLNHDQIDIEKWDARVRQSSKGLPYALSGYLDIVANSKWQALVADNYSYIFPLPFEHKMGLKFYLQPILSQQLGIIGEEVNQTLCAEFIRNIPPDFAHMNIKGNEANYFETKLYETKQRTNLTLELSKDYDTLTLNFSKSLKKRIRQSKEYYSVHKVKPAKQIADFYSTEMESRLNLGQDKYSTIKKLLEFLEENNLGFGIEAKDKNGNTDAQLFIIQFNNRLINLFGASNKNGKEKFAMHFLLNHVIEQHSNQNILFDFEGSEIPGVQKFYQSFGAKNQPYPELTANQLPWWYEMLVSTKRIFSK